MFVFFSMIYILYHIQKCNIKYFVLLCVLISAIALKSLCFMLSWTLKKLVDLTRLKPTNRYRLCINFNCILVVMFILLVGKMLYIFIQVYYSFMLSWTLKMQVDLTTRLKPTNRYWLCINFNCIFSCNVYFVIWWNVVYIHSSLIL